MTTLDSTPDSAPLTSAAPLVVVMGVSGSGKSTIGTLVADAMNFPFLDGDSLHPLANIRKMADGTPLTDEDRWPWLGIVGDELADAAAKGIVIACSALKRRYRDVIRAKAPDTIFLHLDGSLEVLSSRLEGRSGHFMPPTLLASQLEPWSRWKPTSAAVVVDISDEHDGSWTEAVAGHSRMSWPADRPSSARRRDDDAGTALRADEQLSVGQVAQRGGVNVSALHFYERQGPDLQHPHRGQPAPLPALGAAPGGRHPGRPTGRHSAGLVAAVFAELPRTRRAHPSRLAAALRALAGRTRCPHPGPGKAARKSGRVHRLRLPVAGRMRLCESRGPGGGKAGPGASTGLRWRRICRTRYGVTGSSPPQFDLN